MVLIATLPSLIKYSKKARLPIPKGEGILPTTSRRRRKTKKRKKKCFACGRS